MDKFVIWIVDHGLFWPTMVGLWAFVGASPFLGWLLGLWLQGYFN